MAVAMPAGALPAAASPAAQLAHSGNPDLAVTANVVALGDDPAVLLQNPAHPLKRAVSDAGWIAAPVDVVTGVSPGWFLPQSTLDMWAVLEE